MMHRFAQLLKLGLILIFTATVAGECSATEAFTGYLVDDDSQGNASLWAFDLDGDGSKEILGAAIEDDAIVYWTRHEDDANTWTKYTIEAGFPGARSVYAADLDSDGDLDVIGAAYDGAEVAWWSNDGGTPIRWTRHSINNLYSDPHEVFAIDVDNDGDQDVLCASSSLHRITLWTNNGGSPPSWTEQTVQYGFGMAKSVTAGDIDGDGRIDLVGAALSMNTVRWWRNGGGNPIEWQAQTIDTSFRGAHRVQLVDLDRDNDLDVVGAGYTGHVVAWWRNDGGSPVVWTKQVISTRVSNACIAHAADLDGDGDLDVAATAQLTSAILWWRNDGGDPIVWTAQQVAFLTRVWPLAIADLDGDGDNDLITGSSHRGNGDVKWFRNDSVGPTTRFPTRRFRP